MTFRFPQTALRSHLAIVFAAFGMLFLSIPHVRAEETSRLAFVSEYIRELAAIERISDQVAADVKADGAGNMADCIRNTTRFQLELQSHVAILKTMQLNAPFDDILKDIISFDEMKIKSWTQFNNACTAMQEWKIAGPKAGVDYAKMVSGLPKITAQLEYIDKAMVQLSPMIFATVIDQKPDSQNHLSHLIITRVERQQLIGDIDRAFGDKLDQKDQNYTVSAASVLKAYFQKDYLCSDDKW